MTVHFSQIFLTLVRTFMCVLSCLSGLFVAIRDTTAGEVVGSEFHLHFVARKNSDVMHPHFPGDVRQDFVAILEFHSEHCIRE